MNTGLSASQGAAGLRPSGDRPTLRRGASCPLVEALQQKLGIAADGNFDPATEAKLRQCQRERGLVPDGIVGPRSWAALG
jgi:peptidoglycan hydrolase-like protein with peptidoglycan-binding domain